MSVSTEQKRFLWLHFHNVTKWQWVFGETYLRAYTERGHTATIGKAQFDDLVEHGFMERIGCAGARLTEAGREVAK